MNNYITIFISMALINNFILARFLGLCPFLGVSKKLSSALSMGVAVVFVMTIASMVTWIITNLLLEPFEVEYITTVMYILVIASLVQIIELAIRRTNVQLYNALGIYLPLITTNCVILGRADAFACKNSLGPAAYDGFIMGAGFGVILILLGALRELIGTGALFANMDLLFGPGAAGWKLVLIDGYQSFLLAILPPGAFIFTGLIIAGKNLIDMNIKARQDALKEKPVKGSKRVRVTGHIS